MAESKTVPTWGYNRKGEAKVFDLPEGEGLPKGWADTPAAFEKPAADEPAGETPAA